jgi:hypothetical protein
VAVTNRAGIAPYPPSWEQLRRNLADLWAPGQLLNNLENIYRFADTGSPDEAEEPALAGSV